MVVGAIHLVMSEFPLTSPSAVFGLRSDDPGQRRRSLELVANAYWRPSYKYLRTRFSMAPAQAEDAVQGFFERVIDDELLADYDPAKARFRTYLRRCLDHHAIDQHRRHTAARRGGRTIAVDFGDAERELVAGSTGTPDEVFDREWVRQLMALAVERVLARLEQRNKPIHAELFRRFHLGDDPPHYDDVAIELEVKVTDVTNWLHTARREFRRVALELLRELTASEEDFVSEAQAVFGIVVAPALE